MKLTRFFLMVLVAGAFAFAGCGGGEDQAQDLAEKADEVKGEVGDVVEGAKEDLADKAEGAIEDLKDKAEGAVADLTDLANTKCPTCAMDIKGEHATAEYKGKKVHVCSEGCKEAFLKDAEKYMTALEKELPKKIPGGE